MPIRFYEIGPCGQFQKTFYTVVYVSIIILPKFDSSYTTRSIIIAQKSFMKFGPVANFIKPFCHNLCHYQHIALTAYTARALITPKKVL